MHSKLEFLDFFVSLGLIIFLKTEWVGNEERRDLDSFVLNIKLIYYTLTNSYLYN